MMWGTLKIWRSIKGTPEIPCHGFTRTDWAFTKYPLYFGGSIGEGWDIFKAKGWKPIPSVSATNIAAFKGMSERRGGYEKRRRLNTSRWKGRDWKRGGQKVGEQGGLTLQAKLHPAVTVIVVGKSYSLSSGKSPSYRGVTKNGNKVTDSRLMDYGKASDSVLHLNLRAEGPQLIPSSRACLPLNRLPSFLFLRLGFRGERDNHFYHFLVTLSLLPLCLLEPN